MKTLRYDAIGSEWPAVIIASYIVRLSKSGDGGITNIHLSTGEVVQSNDSINCIEARLNSDDE